MSDQPQQHVPDMSQEDRQKYYGQLAAQVGDTFCNIKLMEQDLEKLNDKMLATRDAMAAFVRLCNANPIKPVAAAPEPVKAVEGEVVQ